MRKVNSGVNAVIIDGVVIQVFAVLKVQKWRSESRRRRRRRSFVPSFLPSFLPSLLRCRSFLPSLLCCRRRSFVRSFVVPSLSFVAFLFFRCSSLVTATR